MPANRSGNSGKLPKNTSGMGTDTLLLGGATLYTGAKALKEHREKNKELEAEIADMVARIAAAEKAGDKAALAKAEETKLELERELRARNMTGYDKYMKPVIDRARNATTEDDESTRLNN